MRRELSAIKAEQVLGGASEATHTFTATCGTRRRPEWGAGGREACCSLVLAATLEATRRLRARNSGRAPSVPASGPRTRLRGSRGPSSARQRRQTCATASMAMMARLETTALQKGARGLHVAAGPGEKCSSPGEEGGRTSAARRPADRRAKGSSSCCCRPRLRGCGGRGRINQIALLCRTTATTMSIQLSPHPPGIDTI